MKTLLYIKADTNDADYVTSQHDVTKGNDKLLLVVRKVAEAIKNWKKKNKYGFNWGVGESSREYEHPYVVYEGVLTEDEVDLFNEYAPYGEYGIHTIEEIRILTVAKDKKLL